MTDYMGCESCNRVLRVEDGPICQDCLDKGAKVGKVTEKTVQIERPPSEEPSIP